MNAVIAIAGLASAIVLFVHLVRRVAHLTSKEHR